MDHCPVAEILKQCQTRLLQNQIPSAHMWAQLASISAQFSITHISKSFLISRTLVLEIIHGYALAIATPSTESKGTHVTSMDTLKREQLNVTELLVLFQLFDKIWTQSNQKLRRDVAAAFVRSGLVTELLLLLETTRHLHLQSFRLPTAICWMLLQLVELLPVTSGALLASNGTLKLLDCAVKYRDRSVVLISIYGVLSKLCSVGGPSIAKAIVHRYDTSAAAFVPSVPSTSPSFSGLQYILSTIQHTEEDADARTNTLKQLSNREAVILILTCASFSSTISNYCRGTVVEEIKSIVCHSTYPIDVFTFLNTESIESFQQLQNEVAQNDQIYLRSLLEECDDTPVIKQQVKKAPYQTQESNRPKFPKTIRLSSRPHKAISLLTLQPKKRKLKFSNLQDPKDVLELSEALDDSQSFPWFEGTTKSSVEPFVTK